MTFSLPRQRTASALVAAGLVATALTGCHGGDETAAEPQAAPSSGSTAAGLRGGTFNASLPSGASVRITLPATPPPDEHVENLRKDAGIERALYATISIDNRGGNQPVSVSRLVLTAEDGAIYRLDSLPKVVPEWSSTRSKNGEWMNAGGDPVSEGEAQDIDGRVDDTVAQYTGDVPVGGRGDETLVGDLSRLPATFASMELIPSMGDSEDPAVRPSPDRGNEPAAPRPASPADPAVRESPDEEPPSDDEPDQQESPTDGESDPSSDPAPEDPTDAPAPPQDPTPSDPGTQPTSVPEAAPTGTPALPSVPAQAAGDQQPLKP